MDSDVSSSQPNRRIPWVSSPTHHDSANGHTPLPSPSRSKATPPTTKPLPLASISFRAFALGLTLGVSLTATFLLSYLTSPLWRAPFFLATLSLFHFLEYYTTARCNPAAATISAFLLSQNGYGYNIAHSLAFLECLGRHWVLSAWPGWTLLTPMWWMLPTQLQLPWLGLGAALMVLGQATRTMAMVHAGRNFNHLVQMKKKEGHILVTDGVYGWLRHPSYFGFFWWGLGTQVVMGNVGCLAGYAVVLWRFFRLRIESEFAPFVPQLRFGWTVKNPSFCSYSGMFADFLHFLQRKKIF
ncbi:MAG: hypothetical protein LQ342_007369 [Letrouitia transgressa]|nr:MAG: hypothetical protein LQ342_007369 [Letrouitia transgressa]